MTSVRLRLRLLTAQPQYTSKKFNVVILALFPHQSICGLIDSTLVSHLARLGSIPGLHQLFIN